MIDTSGFLDVIAPRVNPTPGNPPPPAAAAAAAPAGARRPAAWLPWALALALAGGYVAYDKHSQITKPAGSDAPFVTAYKGYRDGWPVFLTRAADDLDSGAIPTKAEFLKRMSAHAAPLETAIDALFAGNVDEKAEGGPITNRAAVSSAVRKAGGL